MKLLSTLVFVAMSLGTLRAASDFPQTGTEFINLIIDNHLKLKVEPNEAQYRQNLGAKLFDSLIQRYPDRSFFVNVYAPVMGYDNHAMRAVGMYDRLHKKNDMRFNVFIG